VFNGGDRIEPRVYWRLTESWLELSVRFLCTDHGVRDVKDVMSRVILQELDVAGIQIASASSVINSRSVLSEDMAASNREYAQLQDQAFLHNVMTIISQLLARAQSVRDLPASNTFTILGD
jgi:hypothetical protein